MDIAPPSRSAYKKALAADRRTRERFTETAKR
jgi:hypothetical protein